MEMQSLDLIKEFESFRSKAYKDVKGVWTIGYGHTKTAKHFARSNRKVSLAQAEELLGGDVEHCERYINRLDLLLNQDQFDALVSFAFNVGVGNLSRSSILKLVKTNPDDYKIYHQFCRWIHSGGKQYRGLLRRRIKEANLYFSNKILL